MRNGAVPEALTLEDFTTALAEMSAEHESLTRSLLGDGSAADEAAEEGFEPGPPMPAAVARAFMMRRRSGGGFYRGRLP